MDRKEALEQLVSGSVPPRQAISRLSMYPWDAEKELVLVSPAHFRMALERFERGELTAAEIEEWANAIEGREDVGFLEPYASFLRGLLHELANPTLTQRLTRERSAFWLSRLRKYEG